MTPRSLSITLAIVGVVCSIAVLLARRWNLRLAPAVLAGLGWSAGCVTAFRLVQTAWPPVPWTAQALDSEPWESMVLSLAALCLIWPVLWNYCSTRCSRCSDLFLLAGLTLSCMPLLAALCTQERFAALLAGNTVWALGTLIAIGLNWTAMQQLHASGAGRWSLWILVGQTLTVAAMIMTCYGRFGEWTALAGIALATVALARVFVSDNDPLWSASLGLPALALNCVLLMHIREYRSNPLPIWFVPLPYLVPTLVASVDMAWSHRLHPLLRVLAAAVTTATLAITTIAIILSLNGPSEW